MLIRFEASNYRSLAEGVELSMVAVDRDREAAREAPRLGASLLTLAAVYGPNASGKSNVVGALAWLRNAVEDSLRFWEDDIPLEPFAFGAGPTESSAFVLEATVDGVRFEYVLELNPDRVLYEGLFHYPEKKRRRVFEREGSELKLQRGLGGLSGTRDLLTQRALALSVARRFDEPLVSTFARDILRIQVMGQTPQRPRAGAFANRGGRSRPRALGTVSTTRLFDGPDTDQPSLFSVEGQGTKWPALSSREQALALLRIADLGIEDVVIDEQEVLLASSGETRTQRRLRLVHSSGDGPTPLDFSAESEGTRTWFGLIGPVLTALQTGSIIVVDELDASLHPTLSAELLRIFRSTVTNPYGAQLVFTSHDTSLLNHLNRDEVWLTEKRRDGATRLGALADFAGERVRKSQNLENAYLHGRFGGLPQVDQTEFFRALGLIG
ncbi:ATP-binding protein [Natronosporangium hydrolyticum]|uniref:ATP-binding protein n=1 Tax=Natronosporangium hydrolyticum TaxID=2811111 RepID=A0A895YBE4_9ACTN|nr:ATP-binding protein [Natronosporangium hydrolyticum]QSB15077.1 ATP-binding protein [Natronosporangium hydrolyticum]